MSGRTDLLKMRPRTHPAKIAATKHRERTSILTNLPRRRKVEDHRRRMARVRAHQWARVQAAADAVAGAGDCRHEAACAADVDAIVIEVQLPLTIDLLQAAADIRMMNANTNGKSEAIATSPRENSL